MENASSSGDVAELRRGPDDHLLGDPGEVDRRHREHERGLGDEVAGRRAVDRVGRGRREAQLGARPPPGPARATSRPARPTRTATPRCAGPSRAAGRRRAAARGRARRGGGRAAPAGRAAGGCARASARPDAPPAWASSASTTSQIPGRPGGRASRRYIRKRVATWSLRDRPARSLPPSSAPARSTRPRSSAECTSSSSGVGAERAGGDVGLQLRPGPTSMPASSSSVSSPARCSTRACAIDAAQVVGRQPPVEVRRLRQRGQRVRRPGGEPPTPQAAHGRERGGRRTECGVDASWPDRSPPGPARRDLAGQAPQLDEALGEASGRRCRPRRRWPGRSRRATHRTAGPVGTARPPCSVIRTSPVTCSWLVGDERVEGVASAGRTTARRRPARTSAGRPCA